MNQSDIDRAGATASARTVLLYYHIVSADQTDRAKQVETLLTLFALCGIRIGEGEKTPSRTKYRHTNV